MGPSHATSPVSLRYWRPLTKMEFDSVIAGPVVQTSGNGEAVDCARSLPARVENSTILQSCNSRGLCGDIASCLLAFRSSAQHGQASSDIIARWRNTAHARTRKLRRRSRDIESERACATNALHLSFLPHTESGGNN